MFEAVELDKLMSHSLKMSLIYFHSIRRRQVAHIFFG